MRLDEALHLMWVDIDLQHRVIHVHRGRRGAPKSGRLRHVPIFDSVLTVLREMKLAKGENTLLWPGARRDKLGDQLPRNKTSVFYPFKAAVERAGLSKKFRLHDLRHTFAGLFLASGGDIFKLSKILGHSSVAITQQVYAHLHPDAFAEDYSRVSFAMPETSRASSSSLQVSRQTAGRWFTSMARSHRQHRVSSVPCASRSSAWLMPAKFALDVDGNYLHQRMADLRVQISRSALRSLFLGVTRIQRTARKGDVPATRARAPGSSLATHPSRT